MDVDVASTDELTLENINQAISSHFNVQGHRLSYQDEDQDDMLLSAPERLSQALALFDKLGKTPKFKLLPPHGNLPL